VDPISLATAAPYRPAKSIIVVSGSSGFMLMAVEMMSGRIIAPTFGSSIYVWGSVITVFMFALSIGYLVGGRMSIAAPTFSRLALLHMLSGVLVLPVIALDDPVLNMLFENFTDPRIGSLLACVILFFPSAVVCGMVTPYAINLLVSDARLAGFYAGLQFFFSTFFSAAGTLLTSFYFVLIMEVDQILLMLAAIPIVLSAVCLFMAQRKR